MEIHKQIAFEKFQAKDSNCDYEELKRRLDRCEKLSGHRYLLTSPRHESWLIWDAAWQAAKAQVPEGFVLVPKELSDEVADELASDAFNNAKSLFDSEYRGYSALQREHIRLRWCKRSAKQYQSDYKAMIEVQEQSHE